ncbi:MAG: porin [Brachymonas sp.]
MKKSLIALAALAAVGAASAQSSVTLYGVVDTNYGWARTTEKNVGPTAAGTVKTTKTGLNADGGNLSGSRWGLKGQEDLGNGLSAVFNVEAGFNSGNGKFNEGGFNRRAVVGLKGGFGQVLLGRDYTPLDDLLGGNGFQAIDLSTYNSDPLSGSDLYTGRAEGIHYSGNFSGVGVKAFASYNRTKVADDTGTTSDDRAEGYGMNLSYSTGPFAIAGGAQQFKNKDLTNPSVKNTEYAVAASYDFTVAKVFGHYAANDLDGVDTAQQYSLGVAVPFGAATLGAQYAYNKQGDYKGHDVVLQGTYALSKRTDLYARAGRYNSWKWKAADISTKKDVVAVGIRHRF